MSLDDAGGDDVTVSQRNWPARPAASNRRSVLATEVLERGVAIGDTDPAPIYVLLMGIGAVPIWFVRWSDLRADIADGELTIGELATLPSLMIGSASFFEFVNQIGTLRPQGPGNGKIEIASSGTLNDGREFQFSVREMGVNQVSTLRHIRIEFR